MSETARVIIVILVVGGYNVVRRYFSDSGSFTDKNVIISLLLGMAVYSGLVLFYKRKKKKRT